jgi:enoyl-CoA hydratase/carnithine racemase
MGYKLIEITKENHIATVALNRVDTLNALSHGLANEITDVFHSLDVDNDVRVVILMSNARIFSAGLDLKDAMSVRSPGAKDLLDIPARDKNIFECCHAIEECKKPVIAAVHGKCVGAGLDIISACDLRLCTKDAEFSLREARIGIVADMGVLQRLPSIIGQMYTRQMAYTGRFFSAQEVVKMGLVIDVYSDQSAMLAAAKALAEEIMESAPLAVQNTKEVLNYSRFVSLKEGITFAIHKNMVLLASEDCKESFIAFMEKRKPNFKGA